MSLQIWNPRRRFLRLENDFRIAFDFFSGVDNWFPPTDIEETDEDIIIKSDLPGFDKKAIDVEATPEFVVIKSNLEEENEKKDDDGKVLFKERRASNFYRKIAFSSPVDPNKAQTVFKDGVLAIKFPKVEPVKAIKLLPK